MKRIFNYWYKNIYKHNWDTYPDKISSAFNKWYTADLNSRHQEHLVGKGDKVTKFMVRKWTTVGVNS